MSRGKNARAGLTAALLRIGRSASRGAESGRLRLVALCLATLAMALSLVAFVVVTATYEGREIAQAARSPHVVPEPKKGQAIARWQESADTIDGAQYSVIYVEPLRNDAPPPPGLMAWPKPGHSALSMGAEIAGQGEQITSRFGPMDTRIQSAGIASVAERLIYVRPAQHMTEGMYVTGWGNEKGIVFGEPLNIRPATGFYALIAATWLTPALALTVIASRTGSAARDRRRAVLHAIGTGPRHRFLIDLGEVAPPILVGAALALLSFWLYQGGNWPLPKVNYVMTASYLDPHRETAYACIGLAAALVGASAILLQPRVTGSWSTRPVHRQKRTLLRSASWLCPLAFAFSFLGPELLGADNEILFLLPYSLGALTALATLPAAISLVITRFGRCLAWWGKRAGSSAALLGGRWISASPAAMARVVTSVILLMGISAQLYTWNNRVTETDITARQVQKELAGSVVQVEGVARNSIAQLQLFTRRLPEGVAILGEYRNANPGQKDVAEIVGTRQALRQAGLPLPRKQGLQAPATVNAATTDRGRALIKDTSMSGQSGVAVSIGRIAPTQGLVALQLVAPEGERLLVPKVKRTANGSLLPGWRADRPGTEWTSSLISYQEHNWWLPLFALGTIAILAFATCLANMAEFLRFGRSLAPLVVITGSRRLFTWTTLLVFLSAFGLAVVLGAGAAVLLTVPMLGPPVNAIGVPTELVAASIAVVTLLAAVMTVWAAWVTVREAGRWRPTVE